MMTFNMGTSVVGWGFGAQDNEEILFFQIRADLPDDFNSFALHGRFHCTIDIEP